MEAAAGAEAVLAGAEAAAGSQAALVAAVVALGTDRQTDDTVPDIVLQLVTNNLPIYRSASSKRVPHQARKLRVPILLICAVYPTIACLGYFTNLVSIEETKNSPPLSPPASPPQPSNLPMPPLPPPSPLDLPSAAYLAPLAVGLIGGCVLLSLCGTFVAQPNPEEDETRRQLIEGNDAARRAAKTRSSQGVHKIVSDFTVILYPICFSLFILLNLTQDFER